MVYVVVYRIVSAIHQKHIIPFPLYSQSPSSIPCIQSPVELQNQTEHAQLSRVVNKLQNELMEQNYQMKQLLERTSRMEQLLERNNHMEQLMVLMAKKQGIHLDAEEAGGQKEQEEHSH